MIFCLVLKLLLGNALFCIFKACFSWPKSVKQKPEIETPADDDPQLSANQGLFIFRKKSMPNLVKLYLVIFRVIMS